jgi:hypothetical protein
MPQQPPGHVPRGSPVNTALAAVVSAAVAGTLLFVLWPPTAVYWQIVADVVGEEPTLAGVVVIAIGAGAWFTRTSGFGPVSIAFGTIVAYATGMLAIELWLAPASPGHLLWYGVLAGAMICGTALWWIARLRSD